tara:strand:+ start:3124 stop:4656 length:1533 start_codon:yes stop_codon:yes gene_type:complete
MSKFYKENVKELLKSDGYVIRGCLPKSAANYEKDGIINFNEFKNNDKHINDSTDFNDNIQICSDEFFQSGSGCCVATIEEANNLNYNENKSTNIILTNLSDLNNDAFKLYHSQELQTYANSMFNDTNKIVKFLKIIFMSILALLMTAIIGSCYEFWLYYGKSDQCIVGVDYCTKEKLTLIDYIFKSNIRSYPYQKCNNDAGIDIQQTGGKIKILPELNETQCININDSKPGPLTNSKAFPYNIVDLANEIEGFEQLQIPVRAFSFGFLFTTLFTRYILNNFFKSMCDSYNNNIKESPIAKNMVFLLLTGIIFVIISYYTGVSFLSSGPGLFLFIIITIINIIGTFGILISIIGVILFGHYKKDLGNNIKEGYYKLIKIENIFNSRKFEGSIANKILAFVMLIINCFTFIFICLPISFLTGIIGVILSILYLNIVIPIKLFLIPLTNIIPLLRIIKSHAELLTILFCISVIGASAESFDAVTTGIMSLVLVIIIGYKVLSAINKSINKAIN